MFRELWIYLGFDLGMFLVGVMLRKAIHWFLVSLDFLTPAGVTGGRGCGLGFFWFLPFLVLQSSLAVKSLVLVSLKFGYPLLEYRYQYLFSYLRKYVAPCKWTSKYHLASIIVFFKQKQIVPKVRGLRLRSPHWYTPWGPPVLIIAYLHPLLKDHDLYQ